MNQLGVSIDRVRDKLDYALLLTRKSVYQRLVQPLQHKTQRNVVFVAGVQRSGTNMVMDMLERSHRTAVFHERDPRAFERYELRNHDILKQVIDSSPASTIVFKALCESQELAALLETFAPARGIWVFRRYQDVVRSHIRKWTGMPQSIAEIAADGDASAGWRGCGMSPQTLDFVRRCYHPALSNASACALFWYFRNILFFEQQLDRNPNVKSADYVRLVADPQTGVRDLLDFLGLSSRPSMSALISARAASDRIEDLEIDAPIRDACDVLQARLLRTADHSVSQLESWGRSSFYATE